MFTFRVINCFKKTGGQVAYETCPLTEARPASTILHSADASKVTIGHNPDAFVRFAPHRVQKSRYLEYVEKSTDFRDHHLHDAPTPYRRYLRDGCTTSTSLVSKVENNYLSRYGAFGRYVIAAKSRDIVLSECGLLPRGSVARFRLTGMCSLRPFCPRFDIWTRQKVDRKIPVYFGGLRLGRCFDFHCRNRKWGPSFIGHHSP